VVVVLTQESGAAGQGEPHQVEWTGSRVATSLMLTGLFFLGVRWEYPGLRDLADALLGVDQETADFFALTVLAGLFVGGFILVTETRTSRRFQRKAWALIELCTGLAAASLVAAAPTAVLVSVLYLFTSRRNDEDAVAAADTSIQAEEELERARAEVGQLDQQLQQAGEEAFGLRQQLKQAAEAFEAGRQESEAQHAATVRRLREEIERLQAEQAEQGEDDPDPEAGEPGGTPTGRQRAAAEARRRRDAHPDHELPKPRVLYNEWGAHQVPEVSYRNCERGVGDVRRQPLALAGGSRG
jgi:hypothetical protein